MSRKRRFLGQWLGGCATSVALIGMGIFALEAVAGSYSLDAIMQAGFKNSKRLRIVEEELRQAESHFLETRSQLMPRLDLSANVSHAFSQYSASRERSAATLTALPSALDEVTSLSAYSEADSLLAWYIDELTNTPASASSGANPNSVNFSLQLTQPLFAQGKILASLHIAKNYQRSLMCKYESTKDSVGATLIKLFYTGLLADNTCAIKFQAVKLAEETHRISQLKFSVGTVSELDTLISRLNLEKAQAEHDDCVARRALTYADLLLTSGIVEEPGTLVLEGVLPEPNFAIDLETARSRVQKNNRQLSQLEAAQLVQADLVRIARADYLPVIFCGGSYSQIGTFDTAAQIRRAMFQDDSRVFLGLTMNLFDGFGKSYRIQQSASELRAFEFNKALVSERLDLVTKKTFEELELSRKKLVQARSQLALAEKSYLIATRAYELGTMTVQDLNLREYDLNSARLALNSALFAFQSASIDLQILMGELVI